MSEENLTLKFKSLICFATDEEKFDDVFLKYNGKKIWPLDKKHHPVPKGSTRLDLTVPNIPPNKEMVIELWDHDNFSPNDLLGKFTMVPDQPGGPYTVDMITTHEKDVAKYSMDWQILWPGVE